MKLPDVRDFDLKGKRVLLRCDLDVPMVEVRGSGGGREFKVADDTRIRESIPTIRYLLSKDVKYVVVLGHIGRPVGKEGISTWSLLPVLTRLLKGATSYWPDAIEEGRLTIDPQEDGRVALLENLRFYKEEETNDKNFAQKLASFGDFYVNDAFAASHREHASIVGIPRLIPSAFGLDFLSEIEVLSKVREKPKRPVVVILGGVKKDKIEAAKKLTKWADYILVGGELIEYDGMPEVVDHYQKVLGDLTKSGEDITPETIEEFKKIIAKAKTIVWSGPMGAFESKEFERGTRKIAEAVVKSKAYTVVGGGDTEAALTKFGLVDKIDFISCGGGAMLEFLAKGTLPGIEAISR